MNINHDEIISAGTDYCDSCNRYHRAYPGANYISHSNPKLYEAYHMMERAERVLTVVSYVTGIPSGDIIQAARVLNRYYERGGEAYIDAQKLLSSLQ